MQNHKNLWAAGGAALLVALPLAAFAATFEAGEQLSLQPNETVSDDLYLAGGTVTSAARVVGDLYAAGGTILVSGAVGNDLVVGGGNVTITGSVGDDLRVAGGSVVLQGAVQGDVLAGGGQVHLAGTRVRGDVLIAGGVVRIDSPVDQDVRIGGGEVYLNAPVGGNVEVQADRLRLGPEARIAGSLTYRAMSEAEFETGASVVGATIFEPRSHEMSGKGILLAVFSVAALIFFLMLVLGALLFALFFKRFAEEVVENSFSGPLLELGRGLLVLVATPIISILLLVTVVGFPLGLLGLLLYGVLLVCGWCLAPLLLGSLLDKWIYKGNYRVSWKTALMGVAAFFFIGFIPFVGGLVQFGFMLLTLGSIARLVWHITKAWR